MQRINKRPFLGACGCLLEAGAVIYSRGDDSRGNPCAAGGTAEPGSDPTPGPNANLSCRQGYNDLVVEKCTPPKKKKKIFKSKNKECTRKRVLEQQLGTAGLFSLGLYSLFWLPAPE